jgi:hypothetical protein
VSDKPSPEDPSAQAKKTASTNPKPAANVKRPAAGAATNPAAKPAAAGAKPAAKAAPAATAKAQAAAPAPEEEAAEEGPRRQWFHRGFVWASTAWGSSMLVHMVLLLVLGLWAIPQIVKLEVKDLVATVQERPDEMLTQVLEEKIQPSKDLALVSTSMSAVVGAMGSVSAMAEPQMKATVSDAPSEVKVEVGEVNVFASTGTHLSQELPEGTLGEAAAVADTYGEAMDRMTAEILAKLAKGKVLVIWCFDQSGSMEDDRQEIMQRIGRVYEELGIATAAQGDALLTAVTSYGQTMKTHTQKPTADIEEIKAAMDDVPIDETGVEMMCQAVGYAISNHRKFATSGRRQLMLILVTDESGDPTGNMQYVESTIAEAKAARCPLYVLGREAVFGYPYARMRWEDPKTGLPFWIQIDRGPETPYPEQLQTDGLHRRWDAHPSGFGPYEQTRMARQTGGVFFMLPSPEANLVGRSDRKYALEAMRPYLPDLSARSDYAAERDKYEMRRTLWRVIVDLNPYDQKTGKQVEVRVHHFSLNPQEYAKEATEEAKKAIVLIGYLKEAERTLDKIKPLRAREASPRWRANFDIMHAQVKAYQIILYEYGAYLEHFMRNPKPVKNIHGPKRPTAYWDMNSHGKMLTGDKFKKEREEVIGLYTEIMKEHAGTPYAARAEWELHRGFAVELHEVWDDAKLRAGIKVPKL